MYIIKDILIDRSVFGTFTIPNERGCFPAVLLLPGFASHKDEIANIYVSFSSVLAHSGIASLRIDYPFCNKSPGNPADFTLTDALIGATKAMNFLQSTPLVDKDKIGFCGFSMGAAIAMMLAGNSPNSCKALLLLSPAKCLIKDFTGVLGKEIINHGISLKGNETISFNYPVDGKITKISYKQSFFLSLLEFNPEEAAKKYNGSFLVIAGQNDFSHENAVDYINLIPSTRKKMLSLPDTDHILNAFSTNNKLKTVTEEMATFFLMSLINSSSPKIKYIRAKL